MASRSLPLDYDLVIYSGTSFRREFRWKPDGMNLLDFTGWSSVMRVGQQMAPAALEISTSGGGILLTGFGQIIITITPQQSAALKFGVQYYNLDLIEPDGFTRRFLRGRVSVVADVGAKL